MEPVDQNARFDEIREELYRYWNRHEELGKRMDELLLDPEEQQAYREYVLKRLYEKNSPHLANPSGILTPARFIEIADSISFLNPTERKELLPGLTWDYRPWIPLGYENTTLYRLLPSMYNLVPQKNEYPETDLEVMKAAFLGVNTTVQPREPSRPLNRRALNLSEQSTQSAESDDAEAPGFIFHELGQLESLECETAEEMPTTLEEGDDCDEDWEQTGFSVVARLSDSGHMNGVYIIYNMFPRSEYSHEREQITHSQ